jgi:pyridoxamine 5'-phosphate oxidase family protein
MQSFGDQDIAYLNSQFLGRLATADEHGQPHATPVGFRYNVDLGTIDIGGYDLSSTKKVRDLAKNPRVSFVVDDLESVKPWRPRGITIRGSAELVTLEQPGSSRFGDTCIRIYPERIISWGLQTPVFASR